jgi:Zn-dependent peptidase ImmA (M78 family)
MSRANSRQKWRSAAAERIITFAAGASSVEDAVARVVQDLLRECESLPTDLRAISAKLNVVQWRRNDTLPLHGRLLDEAQGLVVEYSSTQSSDRQRFTIAHELGHAVFARTGPSFPTHGAELERICDMIATELLMPRQTFLAKLDHHWNTSTVVALAREFETSLAATALRCLEFRRGSSIFLVKGSTISWAYGEVRPGPVANLPDRLARAVLSASTGKGNISFREPDGRVRQWYLESTRLGAQSLFALHPPGRGDEGRSSRPTFTP